jgi:hypothetical protein
VDTGAGVDAGVDDVAIAAVSAVGAVVAPLVFLVAREALAGLVGAGAGGGSLGGFASAICSGAVEAEDEEETTGGALSKCESLTRAVQLSVLPPSLPSQFQVQGPAPVTRLAFPCVQRFSVGADLKASPFAPPQAPFCATVAEHATDAPPLSPSHAQFHGPSPVTIEAWPTLHKSPIGAC